MEAGGLAVVGGTVVAGAVLDGKAKKKLSTKIVKLLTKKKLTVSFAESCTGGLLSSSLTSISGSSQVFKGSIVSYRMS